MVQKKFDWGNYTKVRLIFWVKKPFDSHEVAQEFLNILDRYGFCPDSIDIGQKGIRCVPLLENFSEYYRQWLVVKPKHVAKNIYLRRTRFPSGDMDVTISASGRLPFDFIGVNLESNYFLDDRNALLFIEMSKEIFGLINPAYGKIEHSSTLNIITGTIDLNSGLPAIFWGNFLGPEYTTLIGWEKIKNLPEHFPVLVERLPDDGAYLQLEGSVIKSGLPQIPELGRAVEHFIGDEYFSKTEPSKPLPFSMADALAGKVPKETLRKFLLPPKPKQGIVPDFRFKELRKQRQEVWDRSGGMSVQEIIDELGLEIKGPGGVIAVNGEKGKGVDLPGSFFEDEEGESNNQDQ